LGCRPIATSAHLIQFQNKKRMSFEPREIFGSMSLISQVSVLLAVNEVVLLCEAPRVESVSVPMGSPDVPGPRAHILAPWNFNLQAGSIVSFYSRNSREGQNKEIRQRLREAKQGMKTKE
jgi:hypothetical protein